MVHTNRNMVSVAAISSRTPPESPQLPVSWYLDTAIYALEQKYLFAQAPQYVGHRLMAPNVGDYHAIDWMQNAKALVNHAGEISLLSNICRHRQAVMLKGRGNTQHIVCPLHRWTYDTQGTLLGAPHFKENPCLHLNQSQLHEWHGLLFAGKHNLAQELANLGCQADLDFTGYVLDRVMVEEYAFNWKTFIEVYLEDYHVGPFHPGLGEFVDCEQLTWEFGKDYSVQTVGIKRALQKSGSPVYADWQQQVRQYCGEQLPKYGAIWMVYYPFLMIEWYPNVLVVSHLIPRGTEACTNVVEFYYPEDIALFEQAYVKAQQAAYVETAVEDEEICQRMHDGRRALAALHLDERGPYQHPMETGLEHFHRWVRSRLAPHL